MLKSSNDMTMGQSVTVKVEKQPHRLPVLDFNDQRQRKIVILVGSAFILLCLLYAFASYKAYEYVESNTFCGMVCQTVMGPEHSSQ